MSLQIEAPSPIALILVYLPLTLLTLLLARIIHLHYFHPLSHLPGPFYASISTLFRVHHMSHGTINLHEQALHAKYGPIVRLGPNLVSSSSPAHIPLIHHKDVDKPAFLDMPGFGMEHGIVALRDHREHRWKKRRLTNPYSLTTILTSEHLLDKNITTFITALDSRFRANSTPFDFARWIEFFVFDTVSEIAFGKPQGFITSGTDKGGLVQATKDTVKAGFLVVALANKIHALYKSLPQKLADWIFVPNMDSDKGIGVMLKLARSLVAETKAKVQAGKNDGERKHFVERLLALKEPDGSPVPDAYIVSELCAVMIGGGDTTAASIRTFFDHLHDPANAHVLARLLAEIDAAYDQQATPSPVLPYSELAKLPYLHSALRESQRLFAPVGNLTPRLVSPPGLTLNGIFIPPGVEIGQNPWVLGRDESYYGADASIFRPERWIECSEEERRRLERGEATWGFGPRGCIGRQLALVEMWKVSAALLRLLRFVPREGPTGRNCRQFGFWIAEGFWYGVERRDVAEWAWFEEKQDGCC